MSFARSRPTLRIRSMELKVVWMLWTSPRASSPRNPFNGIESREVSVLRVQPLNLPFESVQWNWKLSVDISTNSIWATATESVQWNWKGCQRGISGTRTALGIRSMELKDYVYDGEAKEVTRIRSMELKGEGRGCPWNWSLNRWIRSMELKASTCSGDLLGWNREESVQWNWKQPTLLQVWVLAQARNPFNGIERYILSIASPTCSSISSNPFNGIESSPGFNSLLSNLISSRIRSMELKDMS